PISNPMDCPWGHKAFERLLGPDQAAWRAWDTSVLLADAPERLPLLVDQGGADGFLDTQLKPDALRRAAEAAGHPLTLRIQPDYDHSYFFIATFIDDHLRHHANALEA
ncbi:MAG TPA: alpha/beta hydrolase-fold protein, partial [Arenibaculum sp.]|nr:alpha/beta hydrolase-fold protein [Arenibaculum sp.]